jgi:hypothetical protein
MPMMKMEMVLHKVALPQMKNSFKYLKSCVKQKVKRKAYLHLSFF